MTAIVKELTQIGKIPPVIAVGVAIEKADDYVKASTWPLQGEGAESCGGIKPMRLFLNTELIPQVNKTYRISPDGGQFALYELIQKDSPFQAYLAVSASLWFED